MEGKQIAAASCCSSTLNFSFSGAAQVVSRCKQKAHAAKTSCLNKQIMLHAKYMHLFNLF